MLKMIIDNNNNNNNGVGDDDFSLNSCSTSSSTSTTSSYKSSRSNLAYIYNHTFIKIRKSKQRKEHMKWLSSFL